MSTFEYLAIAFSLVLSFSAMRIIAGLPAAIRAERRYSVHLQFAFLHLLTVVLQFWALLSLREASWTLPKFMLVLASPSLLFFAACTLIPDDPSTVESWHEYFYSIRQRFWITMLLWGLTLAAIPTVMIDAPWNHPGRVPQVVVLVVATVGAISANERVQSTIAKAALTTGLLAVFVGAQPGFFAR
jgi:hypothetical protein